MNNKQFEIPPRIRIGPSIYTVTVEKRDDDLGKCDYDETWIKVSSALKGDKLASTLLHEMLHCILHEWHINLSHKVEESVVLAVESGLCGFAKDHQKLFIEMIKEMGRNER